MTEFETQLTLADESAVNRPVPPVVRWVQRWARLVLAIYWLALVVATHWPRLDLGDAPSPVLQPDKAVHALTMAVLTGLLMLARPAGRRASLRVTALVSCVIALAYAGLDEWSQSWFDRTVSWADVTANAIGILTVYLMAAGGTWPTRWPTWPAALSRAICLLALPTLAVLVVTPAGNPMLGKLILTITDPSRTLDKNLHFVLSAVLVGMLAIAAPAGRHRPRLGVLVTVLLMTLSAPVIELAQKYTGRGFEVADVYAHELGVLLGLGIWTVLAMLRTFISQPPAADQDGDAPAGISAAEFKQIDAASAFEATPTSSGSTRFVSHAILISSFTLLSRLTGLVRDAVLAAVLGLTSVSDAFFIGFLVPNLFRRLFGEGALTAAFIPHYTDLLKKDPAVARRFASLCFALLAMLLAVITLAGEGLLLVMQSMQWGESTALAIRLTMIMLPYMPLICLVALVGGMLQVHNRFGPPAAAPVLLNLAMIGFTLWAAWRLPDAESLPRVATVVAISVLLAGALQLIWQLLALKKSASFTVDFAGTGEALRSMLKMMLPMLLGLAVFQINAFLDSLIAFGLSPRNGSTELHILGYTTSYPIQTGAVAALQWAQRLYQFPLGVFGIAVATAIFPALAHAAAKDDQGEQFRTILRHGLRLTVFIGLPASVGLILLRLPLTRMIYEHGDFTSDDASRVAFILAGYAASVWAYSMTHVLTRAFYARKNSSTPLKISAMMVLVNFCLNMVLIWKLGAAGLAWSTAISGAGQVVCLLIAVRRYVDKPIDASVLASWVRTALLTAAMAGVLVPVLMVWQPETLTQWQTVCLLAVTVTLGGVIVLGGAWFSGAEELHWLRKRRQKQS